MFKIVLAALLLPPLASPATAQTADDINATIDGVLGDHLAYEVAFAAIQSAVAENDSESVAQWVAYPFSTTLDGDTYVVEGPVDFIEQYDSIITDEVRETVANQRYEDLFVNAEGVMLGNGQMWLNGVCSDDACAASDVRIVAIQTTGDE